MAPKTNKQLIFAWSKKSVNFSGSGSWMLGSQLVRGEKECIHSSQKSRAGEESMQIPEHANALGFSCTDQNEELLHIFL